MKNRWCAVLATLIGLSGAACGRKVTVEPGLTSIPRATAQVRPKLKPERPEVWHRLRGGSQQEVESPIIAYVGDRVWTEQRGRALLMWPDLWVRLYDDTDLHVDECEVGTDVCLAMSLGTVLNGGVSRADQRITWTTGGAEIEFTGTMVMVAYHPGRQLTIVRVFAGQVKVRSLMGLGRAEIVDAGAWALVEPDKPPQVSDQLAEMRGLARELGLWDVFHEVELDVQDGFGPDASHVLPEMVDIVFVEPTIEPPTLTPTPVILCKVVSRGLNLRVGPGIDEPRIRALTQGTELELLARSSDGGWIQVRVVESGDVGWVRDRPQYVSCSDVTGLETIGTPTSTPTLTPTPCIPWRPAGWRQYVVERGNTLYSLARACGTTVLAIRQVNCLTSNTIVAGQKLWLPCSPVGPTPTYTATPTATSETSPIITPTPTPTPTPTVLLPDLTVDIGQGTYYYYPYWEIPVTIFNVGAGPILEQSIRIQHFASGTLERDERRIISLSSGQSYTYTTNLPVEISPLVRVVVDVDNDVAEANEGNNEATRDFTSLYE